MNRNTSEWTICEKTGMQAVAGECPDHGGDACLIVVAWVDRSQVRRQLSKACAEKWALERDLLQLGTAFAELHCQGLNGVVCDPGAERGPRSLCDSCYRAWRDGGEVLDRHDPQWNNLYRSGGRFQPGRKPDVAA